MCRRIYRGRYRKQALTPFSGRGLLAAILPHACKLNLYKLSRLACLFLGD
jgi:hypothetical protein